MCSLPVVCLYLLSPYVSLFPPSYMVAYFLSLVEFLGAAHYADCVHGRTVARVRVLPRDRGDIRVDQEVEERGVAYDPRKRHTHTHAELES